MPLIYCKSCGKLIQNTEKTCPHCGAAVELFKPRRTTTVKVEPTKVVLPKAEPAQATPQQSPEVAPVEADPTVEQLRRRLEEARKRLSGLQAELAGISGPSPIAEPPQEVAAQPEPVAEPAQELPTVDEPETKVEEQPEPTVDAEPQQEPPVVEEPATVPVDEAGQENGEEGQEAEASLSADEEPRATAAPEAETEPSMADLRDRLLETEPIDEEPQAQAEAADVAAGQGDEETAEDDSAEEESTKGRWVLPVVILVLLAAMAAGGYYLYMQSPLYYSHVADKYIATLPDECTVIGERIDRQAKKVYYCVNMEHNPTIYVYSLDSQESRQLLYGGADIDGFTIDNYSIEDYLMTDNRLFITTQRTARSRKWNVDVFYIETDDDILHYVDHGSSAEFTDNGEVSINHVLALHNGRSAAVTGYEERPVCYSLTASGQQLHQQREEEKMQDIILEKQQREGAARKPGAQQPASAEQASDKPSAPASAQPRQSMPLQSQPKSQPKSQSKSQPKSQSKSQSKSQPKSQRTAATGTKTNSLFEYLNNQSRGQESQPKSQSSQPKSQKQAAPAATKTNSLFEYLNGGTSQGATRPATQPQASSQKASQQQKSSRPATQPQGGNRTAPQQDHGYDPRYVAPATSATQEASAGSDGGQSFLLIEQIQRSINELNQLESLEQLTPQQLARVQQLKHNILAGYDSLAILGKNIGNKSLYDNAVASKARLERELAQLRY